jgi:capsular polysaccharide biosynthesis protein
MLFDGRVATESLPHVMRGNHEMVLEAIAGAVDPIDVAEECLSLARYGHGTWGHWLGEILPAAAIVERLYPGRFYYAVPYHRSDYGRAMKESLRAYGIEADRIIPISWTSPVRLNNAWTVTAIWSDQSPHPAALDVMRGAVRLSQFRQGEDRVALLRLDAPTRRIINGAEVAGVLRDAGFTIAEASPLRFVDQVRMFQSASTVFSVLGSGLANLMFSPNHVKVLPAAPGCFRDIFFYTLAQHRRGKWAEVRGPSRWNGTGFARDAPFEVPIPHLLEAIRRLDGCTI